MTSDPLLRDPYENQMSEVKTSNVEGAHDGLFALKDIEPNTVLAFYNGRRVRPNDKYDKDDWDMNAYKIFDPTCIPKVRSAIT